MRSRDSNIPTSTEYTLRGTGSAMHTSWGVATTGIALFNGISAEGADPFYPSAYGTVTDPSTVEERVDWCMMHPQVSGVFHYHAPTTCLKDQSYLENSMPNNRDVMESIGNYYSSELPYRSVLGISKDGRPIYTPLYGNGEAYDDCEVDICNGRMIGGHYAYVSTNFHPYIMGCFGSGPEVENMYQECSANPRHCVVQEFVEEEAQSGAREAAMLSLAAVAVSASLVF